MKATDKYLKEYKCESCGKSFTQAGSLNKHIKTVHEGHKDFKCDSCEKSFTQNRSLRIHKESVHENIRFNCDLCDNSFTQKWILKRHKMSVHDSWFLLDKSVGDSNRVDSDSLNVSAHDVTNITMDEQIKNKMAAADYNFSKTFEESDSLKNASKGDELSRDHSNNDEEIFIRENDVVNTSQEKQIKQPVDSLEVKDTHNSKSAESINFKPVHKGQNSQDAVVNDINSTKNELEVKTRKRREKLDETWENYISEIANGDEKTYQCKECSKIITRKFSMKLHIGNIHEKDMIMAKRKEKLEIWDRFVTQIVKNDDEIIYQCKECKRNFSDRNKMRDHMNHNKKKCNICDKFFVHLRDHTKEKHLETLKYKCKTCDKNFKNGNCLESHKAFVHKGVSRFCESCGKYFENVNTKMSHIIIVHEGAKPVKCKFCDKKFKYYSLRDNHAKNSHGVAEQCDFCGKIFHKMALHEHKKTHEENRPKNNVCPHCGKTFFDGKNMTSHINDVHKEIRRHICELCGYSSSRSNNLKQHKQRYHEVKTNPRSQWARKFQKIWAKKHVKLNTK